MVDERPSFIDPSHDPLGQPPSEFSEVKSAWHKADVRAELDCRRFLTERTSTEGRWSAQESLPEATKSFSRPTNWSAGYPTFGADLRFRVIRRGSLMSCEKVLRERVLAYLDAIASGSGLHIHQIGHHHGVGV